jgi:hypothetical protein
MNTNMHCLFLELKHFQTKVVEKIKIHILYSTTFLEKRNIYEIMWKSVIQPGRPKMTIRRMLIVCCIPRLQTHTQNT